MRLSIRQLLPFCVLIVTVYLSNAHHIFTLDRIRIEELILVKFVFDHPFISPLIFIGIYTLSVCLVIPDSTILTLLAGLLFPLPLAVLYAVLSETLGAIIFFSIFHCAFGKALFQKERPFLKKMRQQFKRHSASYLLFLRISHLSPFWLTNIASAYFKIPYKTFIWTTFVGIIPLSLLLVWTGHSLSEVFASSGHLSMKDIFTTPMKIALIILGLFALSPIAIKKMQKRKKWKWR